MYSLHSVDQSEGCEEPTEVNFITELFEFVTEKSLAVACFAMSIQLYIFIYYASQSWLYFYVVLVKYFVLL